MAAARDRKLQIFLCHSSTDKPVVRDLYWRLKAEGPYEVWLDEEDLLPGQEWKVEIEKAVERSDVVIVCLSDSSINREGYLQKELRFVLDVADEKPQGAIFVIPLRLEDCQVPRPLKNWQFVDYFPPPQREVAYRKLLRSLNVRHQQILKRTTDAEVIRDEPVRKAETNAAPALPRKEPEDRTQTPVVADRAIPSESTEQAPIVHRPPTNKLPVDTTIDLNLKPVPPEGPAFQMCATLVSNELFALFTRENTDWLPSYRAAHSRGSEGFYLAHWLEDQPRDTDMRLPVVHLTLPAIQAFLAWLGDKTGCSLRLPTVMEWETAAIAGRSHWLEEEIKAGRVNYSGTRQRLSNVDGFGPNPFGFHDLLGNAYDLCLGSDRDGQAEYRLMGGCYESTKKQLEEPKNFSSHASLLKKVGFRYVRRGE